MRQLGSADYARPRKFREKLQQWLGLIRTIWPDCPAEIDTDGRALLLSPAEAIVEGKHACCGLCDQGIWKIPLEQIEATVSDFLGAVRERNQPPGHIRDRVAPFALARPPRNSFGQDWPSLH